MEKIIVIFILIISLIFSIKHLLGKYKDHINVSRILGIFTMLYSIAGYLLIKKYDSLVLDTKINLLSMMIIFLCIYFLVIGSGRTEEEESLNEMIDNKVSNKELFWNMVRYSSNHQTEILKNKGFIICLIIGVILEMGKYFIN